MLRLWRALSEADRIRIFGEALGRALPPIDEGKDAAESADEAEEARLARLQEQLFRCLPYTWPEQGFVMLDAVHDGGWGWMVEVVESAFEVLFDPDPDNERLAECLAEEYLRELDIAQLEPPWEYDDEPGDKIARAQADLKSSFLALFPAWRESVLKEVEAESLRRRRAQGEQAT